MADPLFDDEYKGPRFRYGLMRRPLAYANVPAGWIIFSARRWERTSFGTVDYPERLDEGISEAFELEFLGEYKERAA